jgi:DoxX
MMDLLFVGVGWTDLAITLNRIAVGAFFMLSGYHKLFNAERHRTVVDELKALGVPAVGFNQWWVPLVEFTAGRRRPYRALGATRRAWPACHHPRRRRHVRAAANQTLQADR